SGASRSSPLRMLGSMPLLDGDHDVRRRVVRWPNAPRVADRAAERGGGADPADDRAGAPASSGATRSDLRRRGAAIWHDAPVRDPRSLTRNVFPGTGESPPVGHVPSGLGLVLPLAGAPPVGCHGPRTAG